MGNEVYRTADDEHESEGLQCGGVNWLVKQEHTESTRDERKSEVIWPLD